MSFKDIKSRYPYIDEHAVKVTDYAKKHYTKILTMVDGYQTTEEALLLRDWLWYAQDNGVEVVFAPSTLEKKQ